MNQLKITSQSVLYVTFKDGNQRTFWSRDWNKSDQEKTNRELGIKRLKMLADRYFSEGVISSALLKDVATSKALQAW